MSGTAMSRGDAEPRKAGAGGTSDPLVRAGWWVVLGLVTVLPSTTGLERIDADLLGIPLNLRFVLYATAAGVTALTAMLLGIRRTDSRRALIVPGAIIAWFMFTALLAGQGPREWLPPIARWWLYGSVFVIAATVAATGQDPATARRQLRAAIALGLAAPLVGGVVELLTGSARTLNGAPRISSITFGHPVEFSLILLVGGLVLGPLALIPARHRRLRPAIVALLALIVVEMIFSYTRLTLALALGAGSLMVIGAFPKRRIRAGIASAVVSVVILGVASPLLVARFEEPVVWPLPTPAPGASGSPAAEATPTPTPRLVLIDNSSKLRIDTHKRGVGYILASPIVGHGTGSFDRLYEADTGRVGVAAHDDYLLFAVEDGLPGLLIVVLAYAALVGVGLIRLRHGLGDGFEAGAVVAFATLNLAAAIHNPTYFPELEVAAWAAVGLCWPGTRGTLIAAYWTLQARFGARRHPIAA